MSLRSSEEVRAAPGLSTELQRFLDSLEATSNHAARAVGGFDDMHIRVAGECARLRFAGPALQRVIAPAVSHLRTEADRDPSLTIHLWDSQSTRTRMPPPPLGPDGQLVYGKVPALCAEGVYTSLQQPVNSLITVDLRRDRAFYWTRSVVPTGPSDGPSPLLAALHLWLRDHGTQVVHAAAVGTDDGCLLLVGSRGSGKSTAALACVRSRLQILADDYCAIGSGEATNVYSLYRTAKAHADTLERMPFLASLNLVGQRPSDGKTLLSLDHALIEAPLKGILIPRVTGQASTVIRPATPAQALMALAPSTMMQLPDPSATTLGRLSEVVAAVPCYHLEAGRDPVGLAMAIDAHLPI